MARFKIDRQRDSMQCGVACISMICRHFGRHYSFETLNQYLTPSAEGVSLRGMVDLCDELGIETAAGKIDINCLAESPLPCVLHWNQNHFVVLYKISGKQTDVKDTRKFYIADPSKGRIVYNKKDFERNWFGVSSSDGSIKNGSIKKGIALFFEPTPFFFNKDVREVFSHRSLSFIFKYMKQYKKQFTIIATGLLMGSFFQLLLPFLTQWVVDVGINNKNIGFIWLIMLGELMVVIGRTCADFIRRWVLLKISNKINISLVNDFFIKLLKLPMSYFDTKLIGDLLQRVNDHDRIQSFLTEEVLSLIFMVLTFVVLGFVLCIYDSSVFLVFIIGSLIYGFWVILFLDHRKSLDYEVFEKEAHNNNLVYRFITSMQEIKLQRCENRRRSEWEESQTALLETRLKRLKLQQKQEAGSVFINEIKNIFITLLTATAVINNEMTLGGMLAVQFVIGQLNGPINQLVGLIYSLQDVKISLDRINEIHNKKNEQTSCRLLKEFQSGVKNIEISNLTFKYDIHSSNKILDNINLEIEDSKITAIVGTSGSGKTTLMKLLLGYYPPLTGAIKISGIKQDLYDLEWWRDRCGVVMQEGVIFSESISRNIAVGDGDINYAKVKEAAKIACINEFVESLPLKYNTKIGSDGIGLSLGQRQRILIARAIYKNPDFIFLDEATNSLDANNEKDIVNNLSSYYKGKTVVIVAHRLSTVRNANKIIVLDKGKIVESGTHDYLIGIRGAYYKLVQNQIELGV